jgi:hypothetical protein
MQQENLVLAEASADLNMAMAAPCQEQHGTTPLGRHRSDSLLVDSSHKHRTEARHFERYALLPPSPFDS